MRIAAGLVGIVLLGCQSSSNAPHSATPPEPTRIVAYAAPEVSPPVPRRPLVRLNPRRQRLEVGEAPRPPRPRPQKVGVQVIPTVQAPAAPAPRVSPSVNYASSPQIPVQGWPPPARARVRKSQARVDAFMAVEQERFRQNHEMLNRPRPGMGLTPEMLRIAYPQVGLPPGLPTTP